MMTIWKFPLPLGDEVQVRMPEGAHVLSVGAQYGAPHLWALVGKNNPPETRTFYVRGTGHPMGDAEDKLFVGSFMLDYGAFVGHVFE